MSDCFTLDTDGFLGLRDLNRLHVRHGGCYAYYEVARHQARITEHVLKVLITNVKPFNSEGRHQEAKKRKRQLAKGTGSAR